MTGFVCIENPPLDKALTIEEYIISNFAGINNKISKKSLVAQFIKNEEDEEVINELEQELKYRKEILAKKRDN